MLKHDEFLNSYGQKTRMPISLRFMSNRKPKVVINEVLELIDRIQRRNLDTKDKTRVSAEYISYELNVKTATIMKIFQHLISTGLIDGDSLLKVRSLTRTGVVQTHGTFKINRPIAEEDYVYK